MNFWVARNGLQLVRLIHRPKTAGASTNTMKSTRNGARKRYATPVRRGAPGRRPADRPEREGRGAPVSRGATIEAVSATVLSLVLLQQSVGLGSGLVQRLFRALLACCGLV